MFGTEQFFKSQHMGLLCRDEACSVYQMRNETGDGVATFYPVYPGISVMYSDFHMKSSTDFLIIFSYLRKCWKGLLYQTFPAFCVSEDTPHIMAFRSLIWHWKVVKP